MKFLDISGAGNAGKSAVVDLFREIDNFYVPEFQFELDMLRVPGGLLDFRHSLLEDWSPIRSHAAYHEFLDVIRKMGLDPSPWDIPGLIKCTSQRYDRKFNGQFCDLSNQFANHFRVGSYKAEWPYDALREHGVVRLAKKIIRRLGFRRSVFEDVVLMDGHDFDEKAREYIENLYASFVRPTCDHIVFNNGFEPFNPGPGLDMLSARQIIVTRDPRDVFVSGLNNGNVNKKDQSLLGFDNDGANKSFLATDNLDTFVLRYRLYHEQLYSGSRKDILHVKFEDFVLDHEAHIKLILDFLEVDPVRHVRPNSCFKPTESAKNVGLWHDYSRQNEIRFIESALSEYLVEY